MMRECTLIWSFRNRLDIFKESIQSAHDTSPLWLNFCMVDGGSSNETIEGLRTFVNGIKGRNIRICESLYRTTCQEAWNLGIGLSDTKYLLITSSDCIFLRSGWLESFMDSFSQGNEYILMETHSLFGISKTLVGKMGWFDEQFRHGQHVDVDYMIRASEIKIPIISLANKDFYKHEESEEESRLRVKDKLKDRLNVSDPYNQIYFKKKWECRWCMWTETRRPHPPTNIKKVKRRLPEIDSYPNKTLMIKNKYNV